MNSMKWANEKFALADAVRFIAGIIDEEYESVEGFIRNEVNIQSRIKQELTDSPGYSDYDEKDYEFSRKQVALAEARLKAYRTIMDALQDLF